MGILCLYLNRCGEKKNYPFFSSTFPSPCVSISLQSHINTHPVFASYQPVFHLSAFHLDYLTSHSISPSQCFHHFFFTLSSGRLNGRGLDHSFNNITFYKDHLHLPFGWAHVVSWWLMCRMAWYCDMTHGWETPCCMQNAQMPDKTVSLPTHCFPIPSGFLLQ